MNEENAVLEAEEIETEYDDYLSILREMQQSLSRETAEFDENAEAARILSEADKIFSSTPLFTAMETENYPDATTQPLPPLPWDFTNSLPVVGKDAFDEVASARAENGFGDENASMENVEQTASGSDDMGNLTTKFSDNFEEAEFAGFSLEDFAQISPILLDNNQTAEITKPDFGDETEENDGEMPTAFSFTFGENNSGETVESFPIAPEIENLVDEQVLKENAFCESEFEQPVTEFPEILQEDSSLEPEFPEPLEDELPEMAFANNLEMEQPEALFAEFDAPPVFEAFDAPVPEEPSLDYATEGSPQSVSDQNVLPEITNVPETVSFLKERFIVFRLEEDLFAFPAANVVEIGQPLDITPLPFVPQWFLGICNLRGDILSVVGLRELWERTSPSPQRAKMLVLRSRKQDINVGLMVDGVREMRRVSSEEIFPDSSHNETHYAPYQIGMIDYYGQRLCLLDAEKMLDTLKG